MRGARARIEQALQSHPRDHHAARRGAAHQHPHHRPRAERIAAEIMLAEAPGLLQDFTRLDDGTWLPEHRKV